MKMCKNFIRDLYGKFCLVSDGISTILIAGCGREKLALDPGHILKVSKVYRVKMQKNRKFSIVFKILAKPSERACLIMYTMWLLCISTKD
jgi:hypothetical protein